MPLRDIVAAKLIFWDFDGVIKDSTEVKTEAYVQLFEPFGSLIANRVRAHHEANGGMSRFEKLPLYLQWSGTEPTQAAVDGQCEQFSQRVLQGVIDSPWVVGVEHYLRSNAHNQVFVLVSATPQDELEHILQALELTSCFVEIFGAPGRKQDAIGMTLNSRKLNSLDCLMIGDAKADMDAASANLVPFLLRLHSSNVNVFANYTGPSVKDFSTL
jgi:phosphoglycolate phosphatase-like HAD superfamily hydrolase